MKSPVTLTPRSTAWIGAFALIAAVVFGSAVRIHSALSLPAFASNAVEGMLKSVINKRGFSNVLDIVGSTIKKAEAWIAPRHHQGNIPPLSNFIQDTRQSIFF